MTAPKKPPSWEDGMPLAQRLAWQPTRVNVRLSPINAIAAVLNSGDDDDASAMIEAIRKIVEESSESSELLPSPGGLAARGDGEDDA